MSTSLKKYPSSPKLEHAAVKTYNRNRLFFYSYWLIDDLSIETTAVSPVLEKLQAGLHGMPASRINGFTRSSSSSRMPHGSELTRMSAVVPSAMTARFISFMLKNGRLGHGIQG